MIIIIIIIIIIITIIKVVKREIQKKLVEVIQARDNNIGKHLYKLGFKINEMFLQLC